MLKSLKNQAMVLFTMVVVLGALTGANQGFVADSASNATVEFNETEMMTNESASPPMWSNTSDGQMELSKLPLGESYHSADADGAIQQGVVGIGVQYLRLMEVVADATASFVYANQSWVRPWWVQPLIGSVALWPLRWMWRRVYELGPSGGDDGS